MCNPRHHRSRKDDWSQTRWMGADAEEWRRPRPSRDVWSAHWGPPEPWVRAGWGPPGRRPARDRFETDPDLRASDDERERLVTLLRGHAQDGRLDADELEERIGKLDSKIGDAKQAADARPGENPPLDDGDDDDDASDAEGFDDPEAEEEDDE